MNEEKVYGLLKLDFIIWKNTTNSEVNFEG